MSEPFLEIQSFRGPYQAEFLEPAFEGLEQIDPATSHFLVDERLFSLYPGPLKKILQARSLQRITASEENKSFHRMQGYVEHLLEHGVRKKHRLVAIGGGIIQDITCFLASILFRGMKWDFFPTTLLAQADSCIGSKSSINFSEVKNLIGTFHAPAKIFISPVVLRTLGDEDLRSGIGEMIKVHVIDGPTSFENIESNYDRLEKREESTLLRFIRKSLEIKKGVIEKDEFDEGYRNIMNYGHSFGHALEAATDFAVPHGIAVTIGMDMANYAARELGRISQQSFDRMHLLLVKNYGSPNLSAFNKNRFFSAIGKDKKNQDSNLSLILPKAEGFVEKTTIPNDDFFRKTCDDYFNRFF